MLLGMLGSVVAGSRLLGVKLASESFVPRRQGLVLKPWQSNSPLRIRHCVSSSLPPHSLGATDPRLGKHTAHTRDRSHTVQCSAGRRDIPAHGSTGSPGL
eukprot:TRINITY_DN4380_c0_g1_i1.p1 TRINITY_DN4380_c0_g1~~TRINITY_DN4380_c0_g1_i1.p1  ORF type:complete len:100 (+),score=2.67 TRINITY_DN4380_c0_g1_i1:343-642(+)